VNPLWLLWHIEKDKRKTMFKIIVIGDPKVGKTSLIKKFVKVQINNAVSSTVGSSICKQPVQLKFVMKLKILI